MKTKFFIIINLFFMISNIFCLYFIYPNAITLNNGNIFVIHKYGVTVCDSSFSNILKNIYNFTDNEILKDENDLSKITISKFDDGFIVSMIINKIYIFNISGELEFKGNEIINEEDIYFSLVPHKIYDNKYYYLLGFIYQNLIYLQYYSYYNINKDNKLIAYKYNLKDRYYDSGYSYNEYYITNKGLTCQFVKNSIVEVINCFYHIVISSDYFLSLAKLKINGESIDIYDKNIHVQWHFIKYIKSVISYSRTKILFCIHQSSGNDNYGLYNINDNSFGYYEIDKKCINGYYGLKIDYFQETEEIAFSCLNEDGDIQFFFFDKELEYSYKQIYKLTGCESINGYSLLYSINKKDYYILSDLKCKGKKYSYMKLFDDLQEIEEEKEIKEEEKEKEKEEQKEEEIIKEEKEKKKEEQKEEEKKNEKKDEIEEEEREEEKTKITEENKEEIENEKNECKELEKCELCNKESLDYNLCITCNNNKGYYLLNKYSDISNSKRDRYIDCVNNITKPSNFYFNFENKEYRICFELCSTCNYGGDGNENNCTSCEKNYILRPDYINSTNCVIKCSYFYFYNSNNQYKCTSFARCPEIYNLFIKEKGKCIDKCPNDDIYKYQYDGKCYKECPNDTKIIENEYICKDLDINNCFLNENEFVYLNENLTEIEVEKIAKIYAIEFQYTINHVSLYKNEIYSISLYKNNDCVIKLSLEIPEIDFFECHSKLKKAYNIEDNLIIAIITKKINGVNYPKIISYSLYDPTLGEKLPIDDICKNDKFIIYENLFIRLNNTKNNNLDKIFSLSCQKIDIFNLSSEFYTDICYNFESPIKGKDIALKDRILLFYPNITLCEDGCQIKGINLTTFKAKCECILNDLINYNKFINNLLYHTQIVEIKDFLSQTNIEVIKCYKYIFLFKYYKKCTGCFIIFTLIIIQIILTIIYYCKSIFLIKKYLFEITAKYLRFLVIEKNIDLSNNNKILLKNKDKHMILDEPPKKKKKLNDKENEIIKTRKTRKSKEKKVYVKSNKIQIKANNYQLNNIFIFNNNINNDNNSKNNKNLIYDKTSKKFNSKSFKKKYKNKSFISLKKTKHSLEEMFINSNEKLNIYNLSKSKFPQNNISNLILNLKVDININIEEYLNTDPDDMDYDDAFKKDKRKFCEYYSNKLKINQIILNIIWKDEPLRPKYLKMLLIILEIDLYFFINGLFFDEEYISQIFYISEEKVLSFMERLINRLLYITLVGIIINYIIECFFVDEKKIKGIFKREKDFPVVLKYEIALVIKNIIKRYTSFILLSFFITFFTFYYVICFNNVYPSMKNEWIKTSILIIFIMQILSILKCLLETIIRFASFRCKSEKMYKISLLL